MRRGGREEGGKQRREVAEELPERWGWIEFRRAKFKRVYLKDSP